MRQCDLLLLADKIITQNSSRDILDQSAIAIGEGKILALGPREELRRSFAAREELYLGHMAVLPGLINAHTHAAMTFLRGLADDLPLMEWLKQSVFPVEARLSGEIVRLGSLLGYAEMISTGTTACMDMYIFEEEVFAAAETAGLRCTGGEAVFAFPSAACRGWEEALERTADLAEKYAASDRIAVAVNPHSVYTTTAPILAACRELAHKYSLPLHIHLAENRAETLQCQQMHGMRPLDWCERNGLLQTRMVAAHLVDITAEEAARLARAGACGAHNPSSNMKLASGAAPVDLMLKQGLTLGLGTDGAASNNSLNMFAEMGRAALLAKLAGGDPTALPAPRVLDMATLGGARVLGNPALGSLEPGKAADLIALDISLPNMLPLHNAVSQAVYAAGGQECRLTMVGGEILYRDGRFSRFDYQSLAREAKKLLDFVKRKS